MREQTPAWQVQCSGIFFYSTTCIYCMEETRPVHRSVYAETVSLIGRSLVFEKILLATDFSAYAEKTLECIAGFPEAREVILFHVAEEAISPIGGGEIGDTFLRPRYDLLKKEKRYLQDLGKDILVTTALTIASDTAGAIIEAAGEQGASLIVIGARGGTIKEGRFLGSVTTAVVRRSGISVLIMRHKTIPDIKDSRYAVFCPMVFCRVLCPVDFSPHADHALAIAATTPGIGEIILLHVVSRNESGDETAEIADQAQIRLADLRHNLAEQNIRARTIVRAGAPAAVIMDVAEEEDASVIWISSRRTSWLDDLVSESITHAVVVQAQRPVMVIRQPESRETALPVSPP